MVNFLEVSYLNSNTQDEKNGSGITLLVFKDHHSLFRNMYHAKTSKNMLSLGQITRFLCRLRQSLCQIMRFDWIESCGVVGNKDARLYVASRQNHRVTSTRV